MNSRRVRNIIEALGKHKDEESIQVLNDLGTNCPIDEIRELTSKALIRKNTHSALELMIVNKGKGINDLSARVAMCAINELLALKDKQEAIKESVKYTTQHESCVINDLARKISSGHGYAVK